MHNHFLDQKKCHTISHNPKIDPRNRPFCPSGQGRIAYAPHVPGFLIIRSFWGHLEGAYAIRPYRNTCYIVSYNPFSIQIKGQYILHNNFSIQKYAYTISHNHFLDQKNAHNYSHNQKIDLRYSSFLPSGQGRIEYAPHVSVFLIIRFFLGCLDGAYAIRPYRNTCYIVSHDYFLDQKERDEIFHDHFSDQKKGRAISHNYLSIQIKGQYIFHRSLFDQKKDRAISHNYCPI